MDNVTSLNIAIVVVNFLVALFTIRVKSSASREYSKRLSSLKAFCKTELAEQKATLKSDANKKLRAYKAELKTENNEDLEIQIEKLKQEYLLDLINHKAKLEKNNTASLQKLKKVFENNRESALDEHEIRLDSSVFQEEIDPDRRSAVFSKTCELLKGAHAQFLLNTKSKALVSTEALGAIFRELIEYSAENKAYYPNQTSAGIVTVAQEIWSLLEKIKNDKPLDVEQWLERNSISSILANILKIEEDFRICLD